VSLPGAGYQCEVKIRKNEDDMQKHNRQTHEPFALTETDAKTAKSLVNAIDFDRLNKAHSAGKVSNAEYSDILRGIANATYPGDKQALAKFLKANSAVMSAKLAADYSAAQAAHDQQQRTGVGTGHGIAAPAQAAGAANDGVGSRSAVDGQPVQSGNESYMGKFAPPADMLVTVDNIKAIAKSHFKGDVVKAATVLRQRGIEEFGSAV
jgi:hypothetical protein